MSWLVAFFLEFWNFNVPRILCSGRTRRAGYQQYFWNEFLFFCFFLNKRHAHHTRVHRRCGFVFFNSIETGRVCDKVEVGGQVVAWHLHSAPLFDWSGQKKKDGGTRPLDPVQNPASDPFSLFLIPAFYFWVWFNNKNRLELLALLKHVLSISDYPPNPFN